MVVIKQSRYSQELYKDELAEGEFKDSRGYKKFRYKCRICGKPSQGRWRFYCSKEHQEEFNNKIVRWDKMRYMSLKRDNYKCQICEDTAIEVHHIKPVIDYPELEFESGNLQSLCHNCHMETHKNNIRQFMKNLPMRKLYEYRTELPLSRWSEW